MVVSWPSASAQAAVRAFNSGSWAEQGWVHDVHMIVLNLNFSFSELHNFSRSYQGELEAHPIKWMA